MIDILLKEVPHWLSSFTTMNGDFLKVNRQVPLDEIRTKLTGLEVSVCRVCMRTRRIGECMHCH